MEQWDGTVLDINATVKQLGEKFGGILPLHALTGHDMTHYLVERQGFCSQSISKQCNS